MGCNGNTQDQWVRDSGCLRDRRHTIPWKWVSFCPNGSRCRDVLLWIGTSLQDTMTSRWAPKRDPLLESFTSQRCTFTSATLSHNRHAMQEIFSPTCTLSIISSSSFPAVRFSFLMWVRRHLVSCGHKITALQVRQHSAGVSSVRIEPAKQN